jgi:hypothetical protein
MLKSIKNRAAEVSQKDANAVALVKPCKGHRLSQIVLIAKIMRGERPPIDEETDGITWVSEAPYLPPTRSFPREVKGSVWLLVLQGKDYRSVRVVLQTVFYSYAAASDCAGNLIMNQFLDYIDLVRVPIVDGRAALDQVMKHVQMVNNGLLYKEGT